MTQPFLWHCPFCDRDTTVTAERYSVSRHVFNHGNKDELRSLKSVVIVCPNPTCKRFMLRVALESGHYVATAFQPGKEITSWQLVPAAAMRNIPDYVPQQIRDDYREACLIRDLSPKASATLSRRCLQGMIRDFWGVRKNRLVDEIDALHDKVDPVTWQAINAVRKIGNIGAHMEKDINLVIDVEPIEAGLLIGLIETLISEWYVARQAREERMAQLIAASESKAQVRAAVSATGES